MGAVEVADGWICVALTLYNEAVWEGFCEVVDEPEYLGAERFQTQEGRREHLEELNAMFEAALEEYTAAAAVETLNEVGIPAARHNTIREAAELEQVEYLDAFVTVEHPQFGELTLTDTPLHLSESEAKIRRRAPILGEHSEEILSELGYSNDEVERLRDRGVVNEYEGA